MTFILNRFFYENIGELIALWFIQLIVFTHLELKWKLHVTPWAVWLLPHRWFIIFRRWRRNSWLFPYRHCLTIRQWKNRPFSGCIFLNSVFRACFWRFFASLIQEFRIFTSWYCFNFVLDFITMVHLQSHCRFHNHFYRQLFSFHLD